MQDHRDGDTRVVDGNDFLAQLEAAFRRSNSPGHAFVERRYRIGGSNLTLQFAGTELVDAMTRALDHLPTHSAEAPDLCVRLWDAAATGSRPPAPPWTLDRYVTRGEIDHQLGDHIRAMFSIESGVFECVDLVSSIGYAWVRDAAELRPWDVAAPLRSLLGWWFRKTGGQLVHGAAVGTDRGAVLLAARGGSGKSATAVECARSGMKYLSDDYVLLRPDRQGMRAWSLYQSAKIGRAYLDQSFPELPRPISSFEIRQDDRYAHDFDKRTLYVGDFYPQRVAESLPLRAIVVPRIAADGTTRIRRAKPSEILTALAPTTLFQLPGACADSLEFMADVVRLVPGYAIDLGRFPAEFVEALRDLADDTDRAR